MLRVSCITCMQAVLLWLSVGRDFVVSGLVLLCKMKLIPGRGLQSRLTKAYSHYAAWCHDNKKSTNIRSFTPSAFKMTKILGEKCMHAHIT